MPYKRKTTTADDLYIKKHPELSEREIAAELGIDRSTVHRRITALGLDSSRAQDVTKAIVSELGEAFGETELERLEHLRDILEGLMAEVSPTLLLKLSKEYRATLEQIRAIQPEPEADDAENTIDAAIAEALARL